MSWHYGWAPYVPVAERRRKAQKKMDSLRKKGIDIQPVEIEGRKIASTFWGKAWCDHLEAFSDFDNRLPRGRSYVRNGSVCHLEIKKGSVEAKVSGSSLYNVRVKIATLPAEKWRTVKQRCAGGIGSLLELLQGKLSDHVMEVVTDRKDGLFPLPDDISFDCDCPDWAYMCKHVAAVLYGVGARLDSRPELLFVLRDVNHEELIETDAELAVTAATTSGRGKRLDTADVSDVFGIDIDLTDAAEPSRNGIKKNGKPKAATRKRAARKKSEKAKSTAKKKSTVKKITAKKASVKKTTGKKEAAKKTAAKKKPVKKATTKKAAKKKVVSKKTATKKTAGKKAAKRNG